MNKWNKLASKESIEKAISALLENGIAAEFVENGSQAKEKVVQLIPKGSDVFTMTSVTLDSIGLTEAINNSSDYNALHEKSLTMDRKTQAKEMRIMRAAPDFATGSVHAVTEDGKVLIASNTGSQLAAYTYGAGQVVWVVGAQKIVKNLEEGMQRVYEHSLHLEAERAKKAYGASGSNVSKLLIVNKEIRPGRITMIIVNEKLGF